MEYGKKWSNKNSMLIMVVLLVLSTSVSAKTYQFKSFASNGAINDAGTLGVDTINFMTLSMQVLEYNNYYGSGYHLTSSRQDVLNYVGMSGKNYALAVLSHGSDGYFTMGDGAITASNISGIWHLVFITACGTYCNDAMARAFKTVGYSHRASIGFYDEVTFYDAREFWSVFYSMVGSTTLSAIVNAAKDASYAPAVLYGDGSWNGYAWY